MEFLGNLLGRGRVTDEGARGDANGFDRVERDKEEACALSKVIEDMIDDLLIKVSEYNDEL